MAIQFKSYWKTTDLTEEQLRQSINSCKTQDYRVYELFKTFGTLTTDDAYVLYNELYGPIKETSVGRSRITLCKNEVIYEVGTVDGPSGRPINLYTIVNNPPTELKTFNKELPKSISIDLIFDKDGNLDVDKMFEITSEKLDFIINKYNV
jgi:hypothetical protein